MKIAIDISQIVYGTGVSVYTRNLVSAFIKQYPQVEFVLFGGSLRRRADLNQFISRHHAIGKTYILPPKFLDLLWNSFHILPVENLIGNVDIIHTSDWAEPPSKIPKVTTVHDLVPFKYPQTTTTSVRAAHKKKLAWVARESAHILSVSQSTKNDLVDLLKIDPEKITVTYEGVEDIYRPQAPDVMTRLKRKYHLSGDYIFSLSTLEPRKNQQRLIEAFELLKQVYPGLQLLIGGGRGWGEGVKPVPGVIMPGYIPEADLPGLYSGCAVYALPSLYEGFSLSQLQAMACGAAVVTSNISSMPEVVGKAGILVEPEDIKSIAAGIIKAIKYRDELSRRALERAALFTWEDTARLTFEVYQKVLDQ